MYLDGQLAAFCSVTVAGFWGKVDGKKAAAGDPGILFRTIIETGGLGRRRSKWGKPPVHFHNRKNGVHTFYTGVALIEMGVPSRVVKPTKMAKWPQHGPSLKGPTNDGSLAGFPFSIPPPFWGGGG